MADLLESGSDFLADVFKESVSKSVTYTRGLYSVSLSATLGTRTVGQVTDGAVQTVFSETDFIFQAADLILNSSVVEPQAGDTITATIGGKSITHEVMDITGGKVFQYDPYRKTVRVHTKQTVVS